MNTKQIWQWKLSRWLLLAGMLTLLFGGVFALTRSGAAQQTLNCVPGPHSGTINADEAWCIGNSPHLITGNVVVLPGVTLTIQEGVTVQTRGGAELQVQGHLSAIGIANQRILFTSEVDTGPGQWNGLYFKGGTGNLEHVVVRYAGPNNSDTYRGNIVARNVLTGELRIINSEIRDQNLYYYVDVGLNVVDSRVVVSNTLFTGNGGGVESANDAPMRIIGAFSVVTMTGNSFINNMHDQVFLYANAMMAQDARLSPQTYLEGYRLVQDYVVPQDITLTIEPGVTLMAAGTEVQILGHLNAIGTPTQPITFTSLTNTGVNQWKGLYFNGGTGNLQYVIARYGGSGANSGGLRGNIVAQNVLPGGLHIAQSALRSSSYYALMVRDSHVILDGSAATNNGSYSVYIDGGSVVTLSETMLRDNRDGMYIGGAARVTGDRLSIENNRYGVYLGGDTAVFTLTNSAVVLNTGAGVYNSGNAQVTLGGAAGQGNTIMANNGYGANQVGTGTQLLATYNWWGDLSGPKHAANPGGVGEEVTNRVIFDPWAVEPQGAVPDGVYVAVGGARTAPPGGSVAHTVLYLNGRSETITNTVLELQLPARAAFVSASHGGIYWPQRHEVVWRLGDLTPGASGIVAAQVRYAWGLENGALYAVQARLGGPGLPLGLSDPQVYLDLEAPVLVGMAALTPAQFDAERAAHPELDALYTEALTAGFVDGGVVRLDLEAGEPITQAVLLHPTLGEVRYVRRQGAQVLATSFAAQAYTTQTPEGSMTVDWRTDAAAFTGAWGAGADPTPAGESYAACRFAQLPGSVLDEKATLLAQTFASATCYPCRNGGACAACGAALHRALPLPEAVESLSCLIGAGKIAMTTAVLAMQDPKPDVNVTCYRGWTDWLYRRPWVAKYQGINAVGQLYGGVEDVICNPDQTCKAGLGYYALVLARTDKVGCTCRDASALLTEARSVSPLDDRMVNSAICSAAEEEGVSRCLRTEIFRPRDPNAKYGLEGDLVPGQLVTYTITYENEGAGRAYGVFVTDKLDAAFNLATLSIAGPGQLIAANRTLLWDIGELGPKGAPDSQGVVSFTVQLRADVPSGTAVINQATVYFPTVDEETLTNPVINFVRPLVAIPQHLETGYMQPVTITRPFSAIASPMASRLSSLALSRKPQVFTSTTSAPA